MTYHIIIEPEAAEDLFSIFSYISANDSTEKATNFLEELEDKINSLSYMPQRCRDSYYSSDQNTKDLIYKGYTISFQILDKTVYILTIFRQQNYE